MAALKSETIATTAMTWERIVAAIGAMVRLRDFAPALKMVRFWKYKDVLLVVEGAILYCDCVVIPSGLRKEVLMALHAAHQGVSWMLSRAHQLVFWPRISADINRTR